MATVKKLSETSYEVTVVKSGEEYKSFKKHILTHFKDAKIDGFRPGKAPAEILEKTFKKEIEGEILNHMISEGYREAVAENSLRPIADIKLEKFEVKPEEAEVVFTIPVLPEIKLGDYKSVKIEKETAEVTDEKLDAELEAIRTNSAKLKEAEEGATAELNDVANIDFEGFMDGEAFEGGKAEGFDLTLGSKSFIDTFEDQIVGHKAGDEFDVNVSFPENYGAENLAGKPALFKVKLNSIKRREEAELNDDFAKEQGYGDLAEMKEKVRENVAAREEARIKNEYTGKVIEAVVETADLEIPAELVDKEVQFQINRFGQQLQMQGMSLNQYFEMSGQSMEQMAETLRPNAEKTVKADLVISEISKAEDIKATEEEISAEIENMAAMYGMEKEAIINDIKKAGNYENFMENTEYQIINRKTVDFLVESAQK